MSSSTLSSTVVRNASGGTKTFGFLPPHGRALADGAELSVAGDLIDQLQKRGNRFIDAFNAAVDAGDLVVVSLPSAANPGVDRYAGGDPAPVMVPVDTASVIAVGDFVALVTGEAAAAGDSADAGNLAANQEAYHDIAIGIAMDASAAGETAAIRVATGGEWAYPCASATFALGDLIGLAEDGAGTALENQKVIGVSTPNLAVGRCTLAAASVTSVQFRLVSTVVAGGPQAAA